MIALWTAPQGGAWTRLPGPVTAWSILRTDRLGKDSFRVELADAALPPRMLADGRVCLTATRRSGGTALQGGTVRERSVQALAGIGVLHAAGTTYENPAGGRETRWRSALGWPAAAEFAWSMRDRDAVRLTLPGTHALEPGTTAEYGGRTLTLTDCTLRGSAAGITTELTLAAI